MKVFGDAVYFIALLSMRDRWHARAIAINRQRAGVLVTTEWVLTEVGDAFSRAIKFWPRGAYPGTADSNRGCGPSPVCAPGHPIPARGLFGGCVPDGLGGDEVAIAESDSTCCAGALAIEARVFDFSPAASFNC